MLLNQVLIEGYLSSDAQIKEILSTLAVFIDKPDVPYEDRKEEQLIQIRMIAETALTHFDNLEDTTQDHIFHIAKRLTEQNMGLCFDEPTLNYYKSIIRLWARFTYLQTAIGNICIFLTPARFSHFMSAQEFERSECLVAFAIKHFKWLEEKSKKQLYQVNDLIKISPMADLLEEPQLSSHYKFFVQLFQTLPAIQPSSQTPLFGKTPLTLQTPSSPFISLVPSLQASKGFKNFKEAFKNVNTKNFDVISFEKDCFFISPDFSNDVQDSLKTEIEKEKKEKEQIQTMQLQKICQLSHNLCQYYFPFSLFGENCKKAQFMKDFDQRFPPIAKEIFFKKPAHFSNLHFQLIYQCLGQVVQYLKTINNQTTNIPKNEKSLREPLSAILEQFFTRFHIGNPSINSFFSLFTVNASLQFIDHFINPDLFYFILERVLNSESWDLEDFNNKKTPLEMFATDDLLTKQFGNIFKELGQILVSLGEQKRSANVISGALSAIIKLKKHEIAKKMQQFLHQIANSSCSMTPLLLIHRILFRKEENGLKAAWLDWQSLSVEQKEKRKQAIENDLNDFLHKLILKETNAYSRVGGWVVNQNFIKDFCNTLTQRLWLLFKQEESIKLMIIYVLQGVEKAFSSVTKKISKT